VILAAYVQEASAGDEEKILSSGFFVRRAATPPSDTAGQVHDVRLRDGSNFGKVLVSSDAADDAIIYILEASLTADFADFEMLGNTTKTTKELGGFTVGVTAFIRMTALGRERAGLKSDVVSIILT
jgi:hypothetical protein